MTGQDTATGAFVSEGLSQPAVWFLAGWAPLRAGYRSCAWIQQAWRTISQHCNTLANNLPGHTTTAKADEDERGRPSVCETHCMQPDGGEPPSERLHQLQMHGMFDAIPSTLLLSWRHSAPRCRCEWLPVYKPSAMGCKQTK